MAETGAPAKAPPRLTAGEALRRHWPEYLIEAWALGCFMVSAGLVVMLLELPESPVHRALGSADLRRALIGLAMGLTAITLIYSPWGKQSGAHMNPAVTLSFYWLGKVSAWDAVFYMAAQFLGGALGVAVIAWLFSGRFVDPPILAVATVPGARGAGVAFLAELVIAGGLMLAVLGFSNRRLLAPFTGLAAGVLVALYITVEAPLSGMSINPARSFASAAVGGIWASAWIYYTAPVLGMLVAAELYRRLGRSAPIRACKLACDDRQRCIHCGYDPRTSTSRPCLAP